MRIYVLTSVGQSLASVPSSDLSDGRRVLSWMRRRGGQATDEQMADYFGGDAMKARLAINSLTRGDAPAIAEIRRR